MEPHTWYYHVIKLAPHIVDLEPFKTTIKGVDQAAKPEQKAEPKKEENPDSPAPPTSPSIHR